VIRQEKNIISRDKEVSRINLANISIYFLGIRTTIARLLLENGVSDIDIRYPDGVGLEAIKKVSFLKQDDSGYGTNPKWEIFNPNGGHVFQALLDRKALKKDSNNDQYVFTITNRVTGAKTEQVDLIAVIPDFKKESCIKVLQWINDNSTDDIPKVERPPLLTPHPKTVQQKDVVTLPYIEGRQSKETPYGCVEAEGEYYYYQVIYAF